MIFKHVKHLEEEFFPALMIVIIVNIFLNIMFLVWNIIGNAPEFVKLILDISLLFIVINLLWCLVMEDSDTILSNLMESVVFYIVIIGGSWATTLVLLTYIFVSSEKMRNIRYRGYLLPTKGNKVDHMARVIAGDIMEVPPDDFR
jgi:hypothetical protein